MIKESISSSSLSHVWFCGRDSLNSFKHKPDIYHPLWLSDSLSQASYYGKYVYLFWIEYLNCFDLSDNSDLNKLQEKAKLPEFAIRFFSKQNDNIDKSFYQFWTLCKAWLDYTNDFTDIFWYKPRKFDEFINDEFEIYVVTSEYEIREFGNWIKNNFLNNNENLKLLNSIDINGSSNAWLNAYKLSGKFFLNHIKELGYNCIHEEFNKHNNLILFDIDPLKYVVNPPINTELIRFYKHNINKAENILRNTKSLAEFKDVLNTNFSNENGSLIFEAGNH